MFFLFFFPSGQLSIMGMHNIQVYFTIALDLLSLKKKKNAVYLYSKWYSNVFLAKHGCISVAATVCAFNIYFFHFFCICVLYISVTGDGGRS